MKRKMKILGCSLLGVVSFAQVGIGTETPTEALDVVGNVKFSGALMPNNLPGTTGQVLTSAGSGVAPIWTTPTATSTNIYNTNGTIPAATNRIVTLGNGISSKLTIAPAGEEANISTLNIIGGNGGADSGIALGSNYINNTTKFGVIKSIQAVNTNPPVSLFQSINTTTVNELNIGGALSGSMSAPTRILFRIDSDANLTNTSNSGSFNAMSIVPGGNVGIGTETPAYKLHVVGDINSSSTVRAAGVALTSDKRLKSNIVPVSKGLSTVMALHPVTYTKKMSLAKDEPNSVNEIGFIAQEIQKVLPIVVQEGKDENKLLSVNYIELIPVLTKAIQEQQAQIEMLKAEIKELKK